ncbi:MAG TPA: DUF4178 domain-containing protein [Enhygromyxa sp.]|nr:DUF4178 domain-containing protein [Enhygromyxa sp.]
MVPPDHDPHTHVQHFASQPSGYQSGYQSAEQSVPCPECGAPVRMRGATVSAVCEYCNSTVVRTGVDVRLIGKVSAILDNGSPIILHGKGKYDGVPFVIDGRLQVQYERGSWNEWFLSFADGTIGWLADAQGQFSILKPIDPNQVAGRVPNYHGFTPGQPFRVAGRTVVVVDRRAAAYQGAEGMLPFRAEPGVVYHGVDLRGHEGEFVTLDWGDDPNHDQPTPYVGRAVSLAEIGLFPLRRFEGWPLPKPPSGA